MRLKQQRTDRKEKGNLTLKSLLGAQPHTLPKPGGLCELCIEVQHPIHQDFPVGWKHGDTGVGSWNPPGFTLNSSPHLSRLQPQDSTPSPKSGSSLHGTGWAKAGTWGCFQGSQRIPHNNCPSIGLASPPPMCFYSTPRWGKMTSEEWPTPGCALNHLAANCSHLWLLPPARPVGTHQPSGT